MFRFSLTRVLSTISLSLLLLLLWNLYSNQLPNYQRTCNATTEYQNELEALLKRWVSILSEKVSQNILIWSLCIFRTKDVLDKHVLINFLCYGSLWGEIRMSRIFPWSEKAEICILNEQLNNIKPEDFLRVFKENNLNIKYIGREGYYFVESDDKSATIRPFVEIYVFANDKQVTTQSFESINLENFNVPLTFSSKMFTRELVGVVESYRHTAIGRLRYIAFQLI